MSTLSVCTICQDEEEPIRWYLECCAHLAAHLPDFREVVLVDGGSQDRTLSIVQEYSTRVPIVLLQRPFDCTRDQQNAGLDLCTGDFVFTPDADMTWTTNFPEVFQSGVFERSSYWDFSMFFTAKDAYHYFDWPRGVNMRLHRRGPRWKAERKFHVQLEGQYSGLPICSSVVLFENSCRIKDKHALWRRGERRQRFQAEMEAEGGGPGSPDRFYRAVYEADPKSIVELPPAVRDLVLGSTNG
jgi:glycosyltransferase involved in cell wall biosynthesis